MLMRTLGKSGIQVSAVGMGCWTIGGAVWANGKSAGWHGVNDEESIRAIHRALDLGVNFFDTADQYGAGYSERMLARALGDRSKDVIIASKFGYLFDEASRELGGEDGSPEYLRRACEASLRRLNRDVIDLYQLHYGNLDLESALQVRETLEDLVAEGKVRWYGWSTDDPERARIFARGEHCAAIQQSLSIFAGNHETLRVCEEHGLASINRTPLGKGVLTGKFTHKSTIPDNDRRAGWNFSEGRLARQLDQVDQMRAILASDGRTVAQGALAWLWAKSPVTLPIPGFKNVRQVEENAGAMKLGPLNEMQMEAIEKILAG
jgi:aryl-alcohol dehydrogenase-like predicted oxidoreductase